ncbi:MAG: hypothetical protein KAJ01_03435, partial [Candidatus Hydrogenedentes bacterium]|nr:hypothetical protein [Candidatus Hydrogenedentota bacterium]
MDTAGYTNRRGEQYVVHVLPDKAPMVTLRSRGVRRVVCPSAIIPLLVGAEDDYGVGGIRILYRLGIPESDSPGGKSPKTAEEPPYVLVATPIPASPDVRKLLRGERILDIEPLKLAPTAHLYVRADAFDLLPKELGGPNLSSSGVLSFRVITREELLGQLIGKQKEVHVEFFQAMGQQALARGRSESVVSELAGGPKTIDVDVPRKLADSVNGQRQFANESVKAADTLEAVAEEMELNRLGEVEDYQMIRSGIVQPLRELVEDMRSVITDFDEAKDIKDVAALLLKTRLIAEKQKSIYRRMEDILAHMKKLETRLELARRLEGLLKMSIELDAILKERLDKKTGEL